MSITISNARRHIALLSLIAISGFNGESNGASLPANTQSSLVSPSNAGNTNNADNADVNTVMALTTQGPDMPPALCMANTSMTAGVTHGNPSPGMKMHDRMSLFMFSVHDLLAELGPSATPTIVAVKSGNWGNPTTWGGRMPVAGDVVQIPASLTVTVDGVYTYPVTRTGEQGALKAIIISPCATLAFRPDINTQVVVDTLFNDQGMLQIGTQGQHIAEDVTAVIRFPDAAPMFPVQVDPRQVTRGIISDGNLRMYGTHKTAWSTLAVDAPAATANLTLAAAPSGWRQTDKLLLASTNFSLDFQPAQNEVLTAASPVVGKSVQLATPTMFSHARPAIPPAAAAAGVTPMRIHVANLTRNIIIASASRVLVRRGHVMQMNSNAIIHSVLFQDLGRTNKTIPIADPTLDAKGQIMPGLNPRGRYVFHMHEAGSDAKAVTTRPEAKIWNSVLTGSPGWGFVNHSSYARFNHNVAFDYAGAGFVTEDGDEAGEFVGNLAVGGRSTGNAPVLLPGARAGALPESMKVIREVFADLPRITIGDMGYGGHGFWMQGPDVVMSNNISAGNKGAGFVTWTNGKFDPATGRYTSLPSNRVPADAPYKPRRFPDGSVVINDVPLREFFGNQAYGNFIGLKTRFTNGNGDEPMNQALPGTTASMTTPPGGRVLAPSMISMMTVWANRIGIVSSYTTMSYEHVLNVAGSNLVADPLGFQPSLGVFITGPRHLSFKDFRLVNYPKGAYFGNKSTDAIPEIGFPGIFAY